MKINKKINHFLVALAVSLSSLMAASLPLVHAASNTCVWTGAGDATSFNDPTNWNATSCNSTFPQTADTVQLGNIAAAAPSLNDNLGYAVSGLTITNSGSGNTTYTINTLLLAGGATVDATQANNGSNSTNVTATTLTDSGALTIVGNSFGSSFTANTWNITGLLTLGNGTSLQMQLDPANGFTYNFSGSAGVLVQNGAELDFLDPTSTTPSTPAFPIALGGGSGTAQPIIGFQADSSAGNWLATAWSFANNITLNGNAYIELLQAQVTVNQAGSIAGTGFALSLAPSSASGSTLVINPSSNTSATVAGTFGGSGAGVNNAGAAASNTNPTNTQAPGTPDTGFALVAANPLAVLAITSMSAVVLLVVARRLRPRLKS